MVRIRWLLAVIVIAAGCALIDAASGDDDDDDDFHFVTCAWINCGCWTSGCDPKFECDATDCATCGRNSDCEGLSFCKSGVCDWCSEFALVAPVHHESADGTEYTCESSPNAAAICQRNRCFEGL